MAIDNHSIKYEVTILHGNKLLLIYPLGGNMKQTLFILRAVLYNLAIQTEYTPSKF